MAKHRLKIGTDDFKKMRDEGGYYVDKTALIREILDGSPVLLLPRPRRFGKTLNLSMLRYFFQLKKKPAPNEPSGQNNVNGSEPNELPAPNEPSGQNNVNGSGQINVNGSEQNSAHVNDNSYLFEGLQITGDSEAMSHQGRYPVIYMSLKKIRGNSWNMARELLTERIAGLYKLYDYIIPSLAEDERQQFERLAFRKGSDADMASSLANLISHMYRFHDQPVIVLIDEYDAPAIEAWQNGYYDELINFYRSWLGDALKHEEGLALYRAVITGILRVAKESLFSSLNNLKVSSCLKPDPFSDKFGFTQAEVNKLLDDFKLPELSEPIRNWYNGYDFGGITIYNPWSVVNTVDEHPATIGPKWLNTASNHLVFEELEAGGLDLREDLEKLLNRQELRYPINDSIVFSNITRGQQNIWSFLYYAGYLKADQPQPDPLDESVTTWRLQIPNNEISVAYKQFIEHIYTSARLNGLKPLLDCFVKDYPAEMLQRVLQDLMLSMTSYHDTARWPEAVFHSFVLGLLAGLRDVYDICSNPEAGYGRADILLEPRTTSYPLAYIIEFKAVKEKTSAEQGKIEEMLDKAIEEACAQIETRNYQARLLASGMESKNIRKIALVLCGKRVKVFKGCEKAKSTRSQK